MIFQRALVVEDYPQLVFLLRPLLHSAHFTVEHVESIESAVTKLDAKTYDLVVLDRNLPDGDGIELLSTITEHSVDTKVLVLSELGQVKERIDGLRAGADEYMAKPFSSEEFLVRVENLMRRARKITSASITVGKGTLLLGEAKIEYGSQSIQLSKKETHLLDLFVRHPKHQLTRESIASHVWTADKYPSASSIDTFMKRLRTKLSSTPLRIRTRYNLGYELSLPE